MLTLVKLADRFSELERSLPDNWGAVHLVLTVDDDARCDRIGIRQGTQDLDRARDGLLVTACETASGHFGRHAVAEVARAAKAQCRRPAVPRRVRGCEQQRSTLDVVGGVEPNLCVNVAPVGRKRCHCALPLCTQTLAAP